MATPHAAGFAALYLATHPTATAAQVSSAIISNARPWITGLPTGTANRFLRVEIVAPSATTTEAPTIDIAAPTTTAPKGKGKRR